MRSPTAVQLWVLVLLALSASGCQAVAGIFKAGMWVGIVLVVIVIAAIFVISRMMGRT